MKKQTEHCLTSFLKKDRLITDGSFGTYYADKYQTNDMPELANISQDETIWQRVVKIHEEYRMAGAMLIRTNTFASNTVLLGADLDAVLENINHAVHFARIAVRNCGNENDCFIAGDIGPIPLDACYKAEDAEREYYIIGRNFVDAGIDILNFETFPELAQILPAITKLKADARRESRALFIMVQFSVNQFEIGRASCRERVSDVV